VTGSTSSGGPEAQPTPPATIRAVLDTSVLVPAALRQDLQSLAQANLFTGIWSPWIIAELNRVLTWRWIRAAKGDLSRANEQACIKVSLA
jgi:hypothetical protein